MCICLPALPDRTSANVRPKRCIDEAFASEPSLEAAIDHLLSVELIRGVQRTGKWEGGADETDEPQQDWSTSRSRRGSASASSSSKPSRPSRTKAKKQKAKTMPLVDTMQRRPIVSRAASASSSTASGSRTPGAPSADVWSAFASLAAFLSEVVPRAGTQYFISYLHSPDYMCAYEAVQAAISALAASSSAVPNQEAVSILEEMYGTSVDDEDDSNLSVCVRATAGDVVAVMDLMDLLTDLTWWPDFESARENESDPFDTLVKLQSALPAKPSVLVAQAQPETQTTRAVNSNRLSRPTSQEPKKRERVAPGSKPAPSAVAYPSAHGAALPGSERWSVPRGTNLTKQQIHNTPWQEVAPTQRRAARGAHPLAASIPAYARGMLPQNKTAGALARAQRAEDAGLTADDCYNRGEMEWQRRAEAIREAGRHFKSSGRKDTAAMVASHYAARAREAMDSAREWELRGARMVIDRQLNSSSGHVVDLHYATVEQAVTLALETADNWWRNAQRTRENGNMAAPQPLIIVVGKGRHSVSNVGVLGPAVARALVDGGWRIERCEGYIAVKAR